MENNDCIRIVFMKFCILNVLKIKVSGFFKEYLQSVLGHLKRYRSSNSNHDIRFDLTI